MRAQHAVTLLLLTGCASLQPRKTADTKAVADKAPTKWAAELPKVSGQVATRWLSDFSNSDLQNLVNKAVASNHDVKLAAARVREARAQARVAGSGRLPQVSTDFSSSRSQRPSGTRFEGLGSRSNRFETGLDINWDLDVWGRLADQADAAISEADAMAEEEHATTLSLAASVVKSAISLTEAKQQADLAQENINAQRTQLGILNKQLERGLNVERGALDISLSQADLARDEATLQARLREVDGHRRALEILLADYPAGTIQPLSALPSVSKNVPAGLPSELLLRRPDIRAAERRLDAALSDESASRKARLPSIKLTAGTGFSSAELASMLEKQSLLWSLAGSVAQSIFQGGKLKANIDAARARYDQALERYAQTALEAFGEVETTLAAERYWVAQEEALARASTEAERSETLARSSYDRGLSDILTVLDARRRAFDARSAQLTAKASRLRNRVDLHLALGGGF